jgi:hypothetical protein
MIVTLGEFTGTSAHEDLSAYYKPNRPLELTAADYQISPVGEDGASTVTRVGLKGAGLNGDTITVEYWVGRDDKGCAIPSSAVVVGNERLALLRNEKNKKADLPHEPEKYGFPFTTTDADTMNSLVEFVVEHKAEVATPDSEIQQNDVDRLEALEPSVAAITRALMAAPRNSSNAVNFETTIIDQTASVEVPIMYSVEAKVSSHSEAFVGVSIAVAQSEEGAEVCEYVFVLQNGKLTSAQLHMIDSEGKQVNDSISPIQDEQMNLLRQIFKVA